MYFLSKCNEDTIRIILKDFNLLFNGKDILKVLNYNQYQHTKLLNNLHIDLKYKNKKDNEMYLNKNGLKFLFLKSKKNKPEIFNKLEQTSFCKEIGLDLNSFNVSIIEEICLNTIINFFSFLNFFKNYKINNFYVDLYLPQYNICIDCDEFTFLVYDEFFQQKKDFYIENYLKYKYIKINPVSSTFNIIHVLKNINHIIYNEFLLEKNFETIEE